MGKGLPRQVEDGLFPWVLVENSPQHFLVQRRFSWRAASADERALGVFLGLLWLGYSALTLAAARTLFPSLWRLRWHSGEALIQLTMVLLWLAGAWLAWRWPRRLEARPGEMCFGRRCFSIPPGARLEIRRANKTISGDTYTYSEFGNISYRVRFAVVSALLHLPGRTPLSVWRYRGEQPARVQAWLRRMAEVAGAAVD